MLNIISEVNKYLLTKITPYCAVISQNAWTGISEDIICRTDPGSSDFLYFDGARKGILNFSYYCKSKNQVTARNQLETIIATLDLQNIEITTGLLCDSLQAVTVPVYVQKTETGEHIFTASFRLEYLNRRI